MLANASVKYGVLERHLKECDEKLVDTAAKKKWNWIDSPKLTLVNEVTFFGCLVKNDKLGEAYCLYYSVSIAYGSSRK